MKRACWGLTYGNVSGGATVQCYTGCTGVWWMRCGRTPAAGTQARPRRRSSAQQVPGGCRRAGHHPGRPRSASGACDLSARRHCRPVSPLTRCAAGPSRDAGPAVGRRCRRRRRGLQRARWRWQRGQPVMLGWRRESRAVRRCSSAARVVILSSPISGLALTTVAENRLDATSSWRDWHRQARRGATVAVAITPVGHGSRGGAGHGGRCAGSHLPAGEAGNRACRARPPNAAQGRADDAQSGTRAQTGCSLRWVKWLSHSQSGCSFIFPQFHRILCR